MTPSPRFIPLVGEKAHYLNRYAVIVIIAVKAHAALEEKLGKEQLLPFSVVEQPADVEDAVISQTVAFYIRR